MLAASFSYSMFKFKVKLAQLQQNWVNNFKGFFVNLNRRCNYIAFAYESELVYLTSIIKQII